jgi:hypothetical protein
VDVCKWVKGMSPDAGSPWTDDQLASILPIDIRNIPDVPWLVSQQALNNLLILAIKELERSVYCGTNPAGPFFVQAGTCADPGGGEEGGTPPPPRYPPP